MNSLFFLQFELGRVVVCKDMMLLKTRQEATELHGVRNYSRVWGRLVTVVLLTELLLRVNL